jgi:hypothetical protein
MKVGDLIRLKNIQSSWGEFGLITDITSTKAGTGLIVMITKASPKCTIPWTKRNMYIKEVLSECR